LRPCNDGPDVGGAWHADNNSCRAGLDPPQVTGALGSRIRCAHLTWKIGDTVKWLPPEKYPNDAASDALAKVPKASLLLTYERMYRSRYFESTMKDVSLAGWPRLGDQSKLKSGIYGSGHMRIGQEAEAVAMGTLCLQPQDYIAATHAGHHDLAGRGADIKKMTAEFFERKTGYNRGYGGTMHLTAADLNILGMNQIGRAHV